MDCSEKILVIQGRRRMVVVVVVGLWWLLKPGTAGAGETVWLSMHKAAVPGVCSVGPGDPFREVGGILTAVIIKLEWHVLFSLHWKFALIVEAVVGRTAGTLAGSDRGSTWHPAMCPSVPLSHGFDRTVKVTKWSPNPWILIFVIFCDWKWTVRRVPWKWPTDKWSLSLGVWDFFLKMNQVSLLKENWRNLLPIIQFDLSNIIGTLENCVHHQNLTASLYYRLSWWNRQGY